MEASASVLTYPSTKSHHQGWFIVSNVHYVGLLYLAISNTVG